MKRMDNLSNVQKQTLVNIGKRLKHFRLAKNYINYEYLAYELNMSRSQYGTYENGANITITTLVKILEHLGVTIEEFFALEIKEDE